MRARDLLVAGALRLRVFPFALLLELYYRLAVVASVGSIRRLQGVAAIYLTGSFARGELLHGLSDIDFKIFIRGPRSREAAERVRRRFSRLRWLFPMLGPPDEKGVHFLDDLPSDLAHYPLLRHLFDGRWYRHRLVWGEPVLGRLAPPPPQGEDLARCLLWKLKDWTERLSVLVEHPLLAPPQRRWLLYKAVADAGMVLLRAIEPDRPWEGRAPVLRELSRRLEGEARGTVEELLAEQASRFSRAVVQPERAWRLFHRLAADSLSALGMDTGGAAPLPPSARPGDVPAWLAEALPAGARVLDLPWRRVPLSPLDCGFFGRSLRLVALDRPLTLAEYLRLRDAARPRASTDPVMLVEDRRAVRAAWCELMDHWLSPAGGDDRTLSFAAGPGPMDDVAAARVTVRVGAWLDQLEGHLASPELARTERGTYVRFLFAALAGLALHRSLAEGRAEIPAGPREVAAFLRRSTPLRPGFVALLEEEWRRVIEEGLPFREALFRKTRVLLETWVSAERRAVPLAELSSVDRFPDLEQLTVSAVVVTRNRCRQLARCLESINRQERPPDEVVIVDNGSTDDTSGVVARHAAPFPVRYCLHPTPGVAGARNRGLREAAGEVVAFIDDDAVAEPGWLGALEEAFLRDPAVGIAGGSILHLGGARSDPVSRYFDLTGRLAP